jgi:hypothetical protein
VKTYINDDFKNHLQKSRKRTIIVTPRRKRNGYLRLLSLSEIPLQDVLGRFEPRDVPDPGRKDDPDHSVVPEHTTQSGRYRRSIQYVLDTGVPVGKIRGMDVCAEQG